MGNEETREPSQSDMTLASRATVQPTPVEQHPMDEPDIGDEIKVPVEGITGTTLPGIFYHTGIYVGKGQVVSKYEVPSGSGEALILMEPLSDKWRAWQLSRKGSHEAAEKALGFLLASGSGCKETYHLRSENCQHFTEKCLANGIGSSYPK